MKDIGKIKRSVMLTNEQWRCVVMCIAQVQLQYSESQKYWDQQAHSAADFRGSLTQERFDRVAKSYEDDIEKLEEIRMTIGGDATEEEQEESEKERMV